MNTVKKQLKKMSQRNNYTLYDYFAIAIVVLLVIISLLFWRVYYLENKINDLKKTFKTDELIRENEIYKYKYLDSLEGVKRSDIDVKVVANKAKKNKTIAFYKSQHETLNTLSDSSQYFSLDSILTECRNKPFKRD